MQSNPIIKYYIYIRLHHSSAQNPAMVPYFMRSKKQSPHNGIKCPFGDDYFSDLTSLYLPLVHFGPATFLSLEHTAAASGPLHWLSACNVLPSSTYLQGSLPHLFRIFVEMSPS